jgi:hypothetical protein
MFLKTGKEKFSMATKQKARIEIQAVLNPISYEKPVRNSPIVCQILKCPSGLHLPKEKRVPLYHNGKDFPICAGHIGIQPTS